MQIKVQLSLARMSGNEQKFIQEAFDTNWIAPLGPNVTGFEQDLEHYLGSEKNFVCALSAGTAALHLALVRLGVSAGDEVICQSLTFAASANPIRYQGATPVFVDSETDTWNMDPGYLEEAIRDRIRVTGRPPRAIIVVDLYGMPAKLTEIRSVADQYGIPLVEDAAEALSSHYKGTPCGTWGDYAALSFNGNKIITTSGGGALVTRSAAEKAEVLSLATQARDAAPHYQHTRVGYNYRMSNICAGIGRGQMCVLDEYRGMRRINNLRYRHALAGLPGITLQQEPGADFYSNFWLSVLQVNPSEAGVDREELRCLLDAEGIESRPLWKPMHLQPVFADCPYYGAHVSETLFDRGLCLPSGPLVEQPDIERIARIIRNRVQGNQSDVI